MSTDRPLSFSSTYLSIILERFYLQGLDGTNESAESAFRKINSFSLSRLKSEMQSHLISELSDSVRRDVASFKSIQTVGFGAIDNVNFERFIKLGFLCGQRIILWDLVGTYLLTWPEDKLANISTLLFHTALNLIGLKDLIDTGAIVILPHPLLWNEKTRVTLNELSHYEIDPATQGLITALSVSKDLNLHPYTFLDDNYFNPDQVKSLANDRFSQGHNSYQFALSRVLNDLDNFYFLEGLSPSDFYKIVSKDGFVTALKKYLSYDSAQSAEENTSLKKQLLKDLVTLLKQRNRVVDEYALTVGGSGAKLIAATLALLDPTAFSTQLKAVIALLGLSSASASVIKDTINVPESPIIVQTFHELQDRFHQKASEYL